jgi:general stress protein 26
MSKPEPTPEPTLDSVLSALWSGLAAAVRDRDHSWHLPTLATIGLDGSPQARTVVLRDIDPVAATILCHTDARSPKVAEIAAQPEVAWHFYDPRSRVQLRVKAIAAVHRAVADDPLALERWSASTLSARRCYLAGRDRRRPEREPSRGPPRPLADGWRGPPRADQLRGGGDAGGRDRLALAAGGGAPEGAIFRLRWRCPLARAVRIARAEVGKSIPGLI